MKFEKLNENKIRITLTTQDLVEKEIDFHAFMSNSIESQSILIDMLEEAKKETGFDPENYNLKIEALAMADSKFVFTITKELPEEKKQIHKKKFTVKRKDNLALSVQTIYAFNTFDDYCSFLQFLKYNNLISDVKNIATDILLYEYRNMYYLLLNDIHNEINNKNKFYSGIIEFATIVNDSKVFSSKLKECGKLIIDNNALEIGYKYFVKIK